MSEWMTVVYEKGVLRPLTPVRFQEHQTLRIQVLSDEVATDEEEIIQLFVEAGIMRSPKEKPLVVDPVSEEERQKIADLLGQAPGKPLSEIAIEERGE